MRPRFRPGLVPTLALAVAVAVLASLGAWQLRRHAWKQALIAEQTARLAEPVVPIEAALARPREHDWRRVRARGRYDHAHSILVLHVQRELADGARVLTPMRLAGSAPGGTALLVDRGWIPASEVDRFLERDATPGEVVATGILRLVKFGRVPGPPPAERRVRWPRLQPGALQAQIPYRLAEAVLVRSGDERDMLPVGGFEPPRSRVDHLSYAFTWFGMAAVAVATWVGLGIKQGRESGQERIEPMPRR